MWCLQHGPLGIVLFLKNVKWDVPQYGVVILNFIKRESDNMNFYIY